MEGPNKYFDKCVFMQYSGSGEKWGTDHPKLFYLIRFLTVFKQVIFLLSAECVTSPSVKRFAGITGCFGEQQKIYDKMIYPLILKTWVSVGVNRNMHKQEQVLSCMLHLQIQ